MYTPTVYSVEDLEKLFAFMRQHSFAILVSQNSGELIASHLPLVLKDQGRHYGQLIGHMARENSQWKELEGGRVLVIFSGPHAYISPVWYEVPDVVPTWNFVTVHAYGEIHFEQRQDKIRESILEMLDFYGESASQMETLGGDTIQRRLQAIVGFTIEITKLEGKAKLGQKQSRSMNFKVIEALKRIDSDNCQAIARLMQEMLTKR